MEKTIAVTLHAKACPVCSGLGYYKYPGGQKHDCWKTGLTIEYKAWVSYGRPKTIEEFLAVVKKANPTLAKRERGKVE